MQGLYIKECRHACIHTIPYIYIIPSVPLCRQICTAISEIIFVVHGGYLHLTSLTYLTQTDITFRHPFLAGQAA
jgi:hypothetical protein